LRFNYHPFAKKMGHADVMASEKPLQQIVSLPPTLAARVRMMAKKRRLSLNRVLVDLITAGIDAEQHKKKTVLELAKRFRQTTNPAEVKRLGESLGKKIFG
jgi:hypothetical protein